MENEGSRDKNGKDQNCVDIRKRRKGKRREGKERWKAVNIFILPTPFGKVRGLL